MPGRLGQIIFWLGIVVLTVLLLPIWAEGVKLVWPSLDMTGFPVVAFAAMPLVHDAAVVFSFLWALIIIRNREWLDLPYWRKKRSRLNMAIRYALAGIVGLPVAVQLAHSIMRN
jgi:hypothetical protein